MNDRTCIVTRKAGSADELIRFVAGPEGALVPDLKRSLPGRGCWVTAERTHVDKAAAKNMFGRALKTEVLVPPDLGGMVDALMSKQVLGSLGLARKAGQVALGATQVESAVRSGKALLVLHAAEASGDGIRKISQARRATLALDGPEIRAYKLFREAEMGLALGGTNVIHAAVLASEAGKAVLKRADALHRYRGGSPDDRLMLAAIAAEDTDTE